jgi:hypothetical protein
VVVAATFAIVTLLFSLLIGVAALKLRSRPNGGRLGRKRAGGLSVRPPPAHAWIAYQWDRPRP